MRRAGFASLSIIIGGAPGGSLDPLGNRLAVVDVSNDGEVANVRLVGHGIHLVGDAFPCKTAGTVSVW